MADTIVIAGALAQKPQRAGHTWVFLQYLLGFKRLGWDVLFLDRLEPEMCVDAAGQHCGVDDSENLQYFLEIVTRFGLEDSYALLCDGGERLIGLPRRHVLERVRRSAFLFNVMGFLTDAEILAASPRRVFLDIDPGFGQMWRELGLHDLFAGHSDFVTIGQNIGSPDCTIPTGGLSWITTAPPVVLDLWPACEPRGSGSFTSIASWRGAYGPVEYRGKTYGLRVHEFRRFTELPRLSGRPFELALDIHPADERDRLLLTDHGWSLITPRDVAGDPWAYQRYIRRSLAELAVAKNMYVQTNSGWISDRTICYLATGKPVLVQDTGLKDSYPIGEGLLSFTTPTEALRGIEAIVGDYDRQAQAARALAEAYFDSDKVLSRLLSKLGVA